MKRLPALLLICISFLSEAQISKAISGYKSGNLVIAKSTIDSLSDEAVLEKDAEVWFVRGLIYEAIFLTKDTLYSRLSGNALEESYLALKKAQEGTNKKYVIAASKKIDSTITASLLKEGKRLISIKNLDDGIALLEYYTQMKPADTLVYLEIAISAEKVKSYDIAKNNYSKLLLLKYYRPSIYKSLYFIYKDFEKNYNRAYEVVLEGKKKYPLDRDFLKLEIDYLTSVQKYERGIKLLDSLSEADPENQKIYLFNIGSVYQRMDSVRKSIDYYNRALALDPAYPDANLYLGSVYYQQAAAIYERINKMNYEQYNKTGKIDLLRANSLANQALPYLESYYNATKDEDMKDLLIDLYKNLKMRHKIRAIERGNS